MIASGTIIIDGQTYRKGDIIHDLGGWDCIDTDGSKRYYWGKSSEVDNTQSIVNKTEWLLAEPQEIDLTQKEVQTLKHLQHIIRLQTSTSIQNSLTDIQYLIIRLAWLMVGTM